MATPFVAAVVADILGDYDAKGLKRPSPSDLLAKIKEVALDLPPAGVDNASGGGIIVPHKALPTGGDPGNPPAPIPSVDVVISLEDFTPEARARIVAADPGFKGIVIKRTVTNRSVHGDVEEWSFPSGKDFFRIRVSTVWYEIPRAVADIKPELIGQTVEVILELDAGGKVIKASFSKKGI